MWRKLKNKCTIYKTKKTLQRPGMLCLRLIRQKILRFLFFYNKRPHDWPNNLHFFHIQPIVHLVNVQC